MARRKKAHDVYDLGYILQNICIILYWLTGSSSHEIDNKTRHFCVSNVLHLFPPVQNKRRQYWPNWDQSISPGKHVSNRQEHLSYRNRKYQLYYLGFPLLTASKAVFFPVIYSTSISETETKRTRLIIGRTKLMAARTKQTRWERGGAKESWIHSRLQKSWKFSTASKKKAPNKRKKSSPVSKKSYSIRSFRFSPVTDFFFSLHPTRLIVSSPFFASP